MDMIIVTSFLVCSDLPERHKTICLGNILTEKGFSSNMHEVHVISSKSMLALSLCISPPDTWVALATSQQRTENNTT